MRIAMIAAHDPDLVIGKEGDLPWDYPEDLKYFKKTTMGHPIVMGRKTFEEFGAQPLPGRKNVVLSRSKQYKAVPTFTSLEKALKKLDEEGHETVFVAGGENVYREAYDKADYLYITQIHKKYKGDTYFPEYRNDINTLWEEIEREDHEEYSFVTYRRK